MTVFLVTADSGFGQQDLDQSLADELTAANPGGEIYLMKSLPQAFESLVRPRLARLENLEFALTRADAKLNLSEWLMRHLPPALRDHDAREAEKRDATLKFEWESIEDPRCTVLDAHAISLHDAHVRVRVECLATILESHWIPTGPEDFDHEWVEDEIEASAELELIITDEERVSAYTVQSVIPSGVLESREPDLEDE